MIKPSRQCRQLGTKHDCILQSRKHYLGDNDTKHFLMVCDKCYEFVYIPRNWLADDPTMDPGWLWIFKHEVPEDVKVG